MFTKKGEVLELHKGFKYSLFHAPFILIYSAHAFWKDKNSAEKNE